PLFRSASIYHSATTYLAHCGPVRWRLVYPVRAIGGETADERLYTYRTAVDTANALLVVGAACLALWIAGRDARHNGVRADTPLWLALLAGVVAARVGFV